MELPGSFSKNFTRILALALSLAPLQAFSQEEVKTLPPRSSPLFTGPLLAPSAQVMPRGQVNVEPYLFFTKNRGAYDKKGKLSRQKSSVYSLEVPIQYGVAKRLEWQLAPKLLLRHKGGVSSFRLGDLPLGIGIELARETPHLPHIKLSIKESLPLGKYQHLHPEKKGTDRGGSGSFVTTAQLALSKVFTPSENHLLRTRLGFSYDLPHSVRVEGLNSYGGDKYTKGKVHPGQSLTTQLGVEYSLSYRCSLALDALYTAKRRSSFSGSSSLGEKAPVGSPSSEQFSLAPAIEYNFSPQWGLIGGAWFTVSGRNATAFQSGVIALNCCY